MIRFRLAITAEVRRRRTVLRGRFRPTADELERRELFAVTPTDQEQYMLALINRARANPPAEAQRLLDEIANDPVLSKAVANWDVNQVVQFLDATPALPPLAFNTRLIEAARAENARMFAINDQQHSPNGFLTDPGVAKASDGKVYYDVSRAYWATGENIFAYSDNVIANGPSDFVNYFHAGFEIDWGNPDLGHLKNLFTPGPSGRTASGLAFSEIGIGLMYDAYPSTPPGANGYDVGPTLVTQEFGWRSTSKPYLTGIVYNDLDRNSFYAPGEGIGGVAITAVAVKGGATYRTTTWSTGGYSLALPAGTYRVTASGGGLTEARTGTVTIGKDNVAWDQPIVPIPKADIPVVGDFDGDTIADPAVFNPDTADWTYRRSTDGESVTLGFGAPGDVPVPGHYDGRGMSELAVYRPSTGQWIISGLNGMRTVNFGKAGVDVPEPGDYDGDGITDLAVYRPSTGQWIIDRSSDGRIVTIALGKAKVDQPVPADYDGDGKIDVAVYRPSTSQWIVAPSNGGKTWTKTFGKAKLDQPVPADYDGDGKADLAVYRVSTGAWSILASSNGKSRTTTLGGPGLDLPIAADYDGDRAADPALFRASTGTWSIARSKSGGTSFPLGNPGKPRTAAGVIATTVSLPTGWVGWEPSPAPKVETGGPKRNVRRLGGVPRGPDVALRRNRVGAAANSLRLGLAGF